MAQLNPETDFELMFESAPISLWVEDFSGVNRLLDKSRAQGICDFRVFLSVHPEFVGQCAQEIRAINVNRQTLTMFAVESQEELLSKLGLVFRDEMRDSFAEHFIDLWDEKTVQQREVVNYSLSGEQINIHMQFALLPIHRADWSLVLVSLIDLSVRNKAEAYLEYLGKHDALTVMAMDLNGLKRINDDHGDAKWDAVQRRASAEMNALRCCQVARNGWQRACRSAFSP